MGAPLLDISEVVRRSGVPATTLHVWERHHLVAPVSRSGLRRVYSPDVLDTIALVVTCQRSGFSLAEIERLFEPRDRVRGALAARMLEVPPRARRRVAGRPPQARRP